MSDGNEWVGTKCGVVTPANSEADGHPDEPYEAGDQELCTECDLDGCMAVVRSRSDGGTLSNQTLLRLLGLSGVMRVKRTHPDARLPTYATEGSSGLDLYALETTWLRERSMTRVRTGIAIEIPEGYEAQVRPRSGLSCAGVHVAFGSVDRDYRGEVHVIATMLFGQHRIEAGDRLAQLVIAPVARVEVVEAEELSDTARGAGGFGSTGT